MTSRDDIMIEITPQVLLKAYSCGIFPMAESADDPALYWIEPQHRGILPARPRPHVPSRLARTLRTDPVRVDIDTDYRRRHRGLRRRAARPPLDLDQRPHPQPLPRPVRARPLPHRRGVERRSAWSAGSTAWRSAAAFFGESMFSYERDASKIALVHLAARLIPGGFTLLDTQFVTDHLRQFGTIEVDRETFHHLLTNAVRGNGDFSRLPVRPSAESVLEIIAAAQH